MKQILLHANLKRHRGSLLGIGFLVFLSVLLFTTVLSVGSAGARTEDEELSRLGYGNLTAWVSGNEEVLSGLGDELENQDSVAQVSIQPLFFSDYKINGQESDSEGQLVITFDEYTVAPGYMGAVEFTIPLDVTGKL